MDQPSNMHTTRGPSQWSAILLTTTRPTSARKISTYRLQLQSSLPSLAHLQVQLKVLISFTLKRFRWHRWINYIHNNIAILQFTVEANYNHIWFIIEVSRPVSYLEAGMTGSNLINSNFTNPHKPISQLFFFLQESTSSNLSTKKNGSLKRADKVMATTINCRSRMFSFSMYFTET